MGAISAFMLNSNCREYWHSNITHVQPGCLFPVLSVILQSTLTPSAFYRSPLVSERSNDIHVI